jgi:hypothetical protein
MAVRVEHFSVAHPSQEGNYTLVLDELKKGIVRLEALEKQQESGFVAARASTSRRRALRRRIHHELLRHLVTVAEVAAAKESGIAERFQLPSGNSSNEAFRTDARRMLDLGQEQKDVLGKYGLSEKLLDDLAAAVSDFDASVEESNEGRREHVGARADLKAVSDEVMRLVTMLDGLNRYRFAGNAELLAAWESARNVVSGPRPAEAEPAAGSPAQPPANERPAA